MQLLNISRFSYLHFPAKKLANYSRSLSNKRALTTLFFGGRRPVSSVFLTGIVLGTGFIVPIAGFYHFSGLRGAVGTVRVVGAEIKLAQALVHRDGTPSQSLSVLRVAAKTFVQGNPVALFLIDKAFDAVDAAVDAHAKEAAVVIDNLGAKMNDIVEQQETVTLPAMVDMVKVVQTETEKLHEGAWEAERNPELHETVLQALEGAGQDIAKFAENVGKSIASLFAGNAPDQAQAPSGEPQEVTDNGSQDLMKSEPQDVMDAEPHVIVDDELQASVADEPQVVVDGNSAVKENEG
ncbi:hypothetical protein EST38_g2511 [Candolleomyces aberdarensis]|uniref:Transmembrane protein n=1 Tax=Candolleomyces aberdarensis TaxID=2316362 RepID=A0A4Q2DTC1_9AGAR|nr:hypothetical protein EST38_g2511 [Candolleomyces aberdarensis]